jgi:hypothetical protein
VAAGSNPAPSVLELFPESFLGFGRDRVVVYLKNQKAPVTQLVRVLCLYCYRYARVVLIPHWHVQMKRKSRGFDPRREHCVKEWWCTLKTILDRVPKSGQRGQTQVLMCMLRGFESRLCHVMYTKKVTFAPDVKSGKYTSLRELIRSQENKTKKQKKYIGKYVLIVDYF